MTITVSVVHKKRDPRITSVPLLSCNYYSYGHDVNGENVTVLEDLVEIDSLILDLEGRDYMLSANAYETLKRKCSQDWEAFKYLQERVRDVRISEQWRNKMHEIIMIIRMKAEVNQMLGIW